MRDVIEALDAGAPPPFAAITASPESTIGSRAGAVAPSGRAPGAVTHTQAFCGEVVAALAVWAAVTDDATLREALQALPEQVARAVEAAAAWVEDLPPR